MAIAVTDDSIEKKIVDACKVGENIYLIGSFGWFVNFSARQTRALNLVWALHQLKLLDRQRPIAVIGGGLTGISAAAALIGLGHSVDLYEARKELMAHQLTTEHRLIHPTINRWPFTPLMPATNLPFLNWVSGPCSKVISGLLQETEDMQKQNSDRFSIIRNRKIDDIVTGFNGHLIGGGGETVDKAYQAIILAVGFGKERHHDKLGSVSYWYPDGIEHEVLVGDVKYFLVSGCGDGGLIDALRIVHRDFDKGGLVFETANALFKTEVGEHVAAAERGNRKPSQLQSAYMGAAQEIKSNPIYARVHEKLIRSAGAERPLVRLSARSAENPFASRAAPIHKLMVAHACLINKIVYTRGELGVTSKKITIAGKPFLKEGHTRVVVRHGPEGAPLRDIFGELDIEKARRDQEELEQTLVEPAWPGDYPSGTKENRREKTRRLHLQAARAIRLMHPTASVSVSSVGYDVILPDDVDVDDLPTEVFGIPVRVVKLRAEKI